MAYAGGKGKSSWEDDHYEDEEEYYEEDEEFEEDPDVARMQAAKKAAEDAKKAAAQKAAADAKKAAASKPKKQEPAPVKVAEPEPERPLSSGEKKKIEEDNRKMNYELSAELFGGVSVNAISRPSIKLPRNESFETYEPKTDAEYELFAEYIGGHVAINSNEFQYRNFLKSLLKAATSHLQPAEIDELSVGLAGIREEREKAIHAARTAQPVQTRADDYASDFM